MDLRLRDDVVLISGASGGIGRATASLLAAEGARLALVAGRRRDELAAWVDGQSWSEQAACLAADVADPGSVESAFVAAHEHFGRVDHAIVNAGIWPSADVPLVDLTDDRLRSVIDVCLLGAAWTARSFLRGLRDVGYGRTQPTLTFVGSTAARFGEAGHAEYAAAKAGLRGLTLTLKNEIVALAPAGRVNLVEPGWTATELVTDELDAPGNVSRAVATRALAQVARASDIAQAIVMLTSPLSRHVTGEFLTVSGGMEGRLLRDPASVDEDRIRAEARDD